MPTYFLRVLKDMKAIIHILHLLSDLYLHFIQEAIKECIVDKMFHYNGNSPSSNTTAFLVETLQLFAHEFLIAINTFPSS